jgi:hypothetical protein
MALLAAQLLAKELDITGKCVLTSNQDYQTHYDDDGDGYAGAEVDGAI